MKRFSVYVGVLLSVLIVWELVYSAGIRINTTPSIPLGVYQLSNEPLVKGAYVLFCRKRSIERVLPLSRKMGFFNVPR